MAREADSRSRALRMIASREFGSSKPLTRRVLLLDADPVKVGLDEEEVGVAVPPEETPLTGVSSGCEGGVAGDGWCEPAERGCSTFSRRARARSCPVFSGRFGCAVPIEPLALPPALLPDKVGLG